MQQKTHDNVCVTNKEARRLPLAEPPKSLRAQAHSCRTVMPQSHSAKVGRDGDAGFQNALASLFSWRRVPDASLAVLPTLLRFRLSDLGSAHVDAT